VLPGQTVHVTKQFNVFHMEQALALSGQGIERLGLRKGKGQGVFHNHMLSSRKGLGGDRPMVGVDRSNNH
jgi:hypothetical protein